MRLRFLVGNLATALVAVLSPHSASALQAEHSTDSSELRIPVGSASLHVRTIGRGQPLIVLHGGPDFDYGYLLPELDRFKDEFRLIYYDQRGRGTSADHVRPEDVTLASDVDDIDRVRRHFRLDSPALLGHSWGTVLALEYALRNPTRVSHLILMNPAPASASDVAVLRKAYLAKLGAEMDKQRAIVSSSAYQVGDPEAVAARYRIHFKPALTRPEDYEKLMARMKAGFISQGREGIVKARAVEDRLMRDSWDVPTYDLLPKLRSLNVPTLVITGDQDFIPVEVAEHIARAIPNATLVTIKGCGHFSYLECPDEVRAAVDDFFRRTTPLSVQPPPDVKVGARVRLWLPEPYRQAEGPVRRQLLRGTVEGVRGDTLLLSIRGAVGGIAIPRAAVRRLEVSGGVSRPTSAVERAVGGAIGGAVTWALMNDPRRKGGPHYRTDWRAAGVGASWGAGIGALTGLIFPHERWRRVRLGH
ncbi:MAG TPA: alpha/beta hydrolase [Jatrophihabitantaceae bacterium]|nr:alpha/beta hydrolase [Jatrophihabitantaceae bacterium]